MATEEMHDKKEQQTEPFDIIWLFRYLWDFRKTILKWALGVAVFFLIIALLKKPVYTADATIVPLNNNATKTGLAGLAGLASGAMGISLSSLSSSSNSVNVITADMYEKVMQSSSFLLELGNVKIDMGERGKMSMYERAIADTVPTVFGSIMKYTIGLPGVVKMAISGEEPLPADYVYPDTFTYAKLSGAQKSVLRNLEGMVNIVEDEELSCYYISVSGETPEMAAELCAAAIKVLEYRVAEYNTKQLDTKLNVAQKQLEAVQQEYQKVRAEYFNYKRTHKYIEEDHESLEYQTLSDNYELLHSLVQNSTSAVASIKIDMSELQQPFITLAPVNMPDKKTSPKIKLYFIGGFIAGLLGAIGCLLLQLAYVQAFAPKRYKDIYERYKVSTHETSNVDA
ncbi:MAG: hypothetical protein K6G73_01005 [Marinilabiliaceae bacterium]|nr:hypothetical protein [Marinilabiliaceae bacterium]